MFNFTSLNLREIATATIGAFLLTTTFVGAAIGPARAAETAPVSFQA